MSPNPRTLLLCLLLAIVSWGVAAEGISVKSARVVAGDEGYTLDAAFNVVFNQTIEDVLNRGVALNLRAEFELIRPRWYWLDERVSEQVREWRLAYDVLPRKYRLSTGALYQNFDQLEDAQRVLSVFRENLALGHDSVHSGSVYRARVRMRLDVSRLPKPFQVNAITGRDWNLGSDWHYFEFRP